MSLGISSKFPDDRMELEHSDYELSPFPSLANRVSSQWLAKGRTLRETTAPLRAACKGSVLIIKNKCLNPTKGLKKPKMSDELAQQIKVLVTKLNGLSSVPRSHVKEGEN